jgi:hypothetical protein
MAVPVRSAGRMTLAGVRAKNMLVAPIPIGRKFEVSDGSD